jgi:hypothetical protein
VSVSRTLHDIIGDLVAVAELQLDAALSLNPTALQEATAARQDLAFEISLAEDHERASAHGDPALVELLQQLNEIDGRCMHVLEVGLGVIEGIRPHSEASATYRPDGRFKGPHA